MPHLHHSCQEQAALFQPVMADIQDYSRGLFLLALEDLPEGFSFKAGQFVHIRVSSSDHPLLRRPISIQRVHQGRLELLIREVGVGTQLLHLSKPGDRLDVLGPLGTAFSPIQPGERVLMAGGGVGVAPLLAVIDQAAVGAAGDLCYGVSTASEIQELDPFQRKDCFFTFHFSTDDGSRGHQGFCTDVARLLAGKQVYNRIYTCGPWIMMQKVFEIACEAGLPVEASLEVQMGCGLGACLGCVYQSTDGEFIRSCIDGPVVDGYTVEWERA